MENQSTGWRLVLIVVGTVDDRGGMNAIVKLGGQILSACLYFSLDSTFWEFSLFGFSFPFLISGAIFLGLDHSEELSPIYPLHGIMVTITHMQEEGLRRCSAPPKVGQPNVLFRLLFCIGLGFSGWVFGS